jgi:hypothetical protein
MVMELMLAYIIESKERYNTSIDAIESDFDLDDDAVVTVREFMKISLHNCWSKLDKYYKILDLSFIYAAAIVLHPVYKWRYFEKI